MKYLINSTDIFRFDTEAEAETFLNNLKKNFNFEITSSTITKKSGKNKITEETEDYITLKVKKVFNDEKSPTVPYQEEVEAVEFDG